MKDALIESKGREIQLIQEPKLHAKVLAWDDDTVVISSQNWLSADPADSKLRKEIGVFVQAQGIARDLINDFEASQLTKSQVTS
ncbi:phospholipase D-like domain-containing protein [Pararobbsia alpina]|uniref:Phospholipase D-like domain-containing protein n=1 Tax=Pararobbsia alpina TaxID=621374 RepID=A0A6S7BF71_9BURK|nr:phospholipase D-like domain-containing protein [Pararobbsia alpina]CAB3798030.1 hypothetical protein LMG28138_04363 [Pararobbsia alpina]